MTRATNRGVLFGVIGMTTVGLLGVTACRATVAGDPNRPIKIEAHITLDVRQVKQAASSIEDEISGKAPAQKPMSRLQEWVLPSAWAEAAQLKVKTPEVQSAIDSRKARYDAIKVFKAQGAIGEDNQGHVAALSGGAEAQLVAAENADRELIYRAIVEQNNLPAGAIGTIRSTFAQEQRERAASGEKIQLPSGEWVRK